MLLDIGDGLIQHLGHRLVVVAGAFVVGELALVLADIHRLVDGAQAGRTRNLERQGLRRVAFRRVVRRGGAGTLRQRRIDRCGQGAAESEDTERRGYEPMAGCKKIGMSYRVPPEFAEGRSLQV